MATISRFIALGLACLLTACCGDPTATDIGADASIDGTIVTIDANNTDAPTACECPMLNPGDMFTVCGRQEPMYYIVDPQGEVMYFPNGTNSQAFNSWRATDNNLLSISPDCFDRLRVPVQYPGGVNFRPGTYIVKRVGANFPQLYVIQPNNTLAPISAAVAATLCVPADAGGVGCNPIEILDVFWPNFTHRAPEVTQTHVYPGMLFVIANTETIYYADPNGTMREVTSVGFDANYFQRKFIRRVPLSAISGMSFGELITGRVPRIDDPTQGGN